MPPLHRRLVLYFLLLTAATAAASISAPVELTVASHPLSPLRLPPAAPFAGEGATGGPFCTRVHIRGRPSRLRDPSRFFHALRVRANATRPSGLDLCFHRNATIGPCKCAASQWHKMPKSGLWVQAISPYDTRIIDFRMPLDPSRSILVSTEEEFLLHRVVFLLLGMVLMAVAHTLSESVVFYYGGAMTIGIFLVILVILFQGMKLLPTGRKSSLAIFMYSSLVGMTTYFLHYLSGLLRSVLVEIGIAEDMHNPLGVFLLVSVILAGAWFGYWGVRKLVLTEEGSVDAGVAYFVEWAILIISAVMILQSSLDYLFAFSALVFCTIVKAVSRIEGKSRFLRCLSRGFSKIIPTSYEGLDEEYSSMNGSHQDGFSKLHGSRKTLSQGLATDSYYSTFHTNPERRKFSEEEYAAFTREETNKAMKQLISSPDFNSWALANVDRISVTPQRTRQNSSSQQRKRLFGLF
ncbi:hypothetical protein E2562_020504 [Oryza meyeriana var. granulata]|uniref:Uncharacterized protein n=1 Tax=Oryza meyeriana var. granulata TaxID=110450 RepID=A0A6G1EAT7_9ORYZ|nr:hypothetical protein E2562_020504 [Oryza meyeriana var. granulata]